MRTPLSKRRTCRGSTSRRVSVTDGAGPGGYIGGYSHLAPSSQRPTGERVTAFIVMDDEDDLLNVRKRALSLLLPSTYVPFADSQSVPSC